MTIWLWSGPVLIVVVPIVMLPTLLKMLYDESGVIGH